MSVRLRVRSLAKTLRAPRGLQRRRGPPFSLGPLDFEIGAGEAVALLGPNGAGKTSLLRLLAGVYSPDAGGVEVRGRRGPLIGLVSPFSGALTALEHLRAYATAAGAGLNIDAAMELAGLESVAERPVSQLSTGQRVRLALAPALLIPADVYLVDEALAVCDPTFRARAVALLRERVADGAALILAGQDLLAPRALCGRGLVLSEGRIVMDGDVDEAITAFTLLRSLADGPAGEESAAEAGGGRGTAAVHLDALEVVAVDGTGPDGLVEVRLRLRGLPGACQVLLGVKADAGTVLFRSHTAVPADALGSGGTLDLRAGIPRACLGPGEHYLVVAATDPAGVSLLDRKQGAVLELPDSTPSAPA